MIAITSFLVLATLLCLAFKATRLIGVIAVSILFFLYPLVTMVMRALANVTLHLPLFLHP